MFIKIRPIVTIAAVIIGFAPMGSVDVVLADSPSAAPTREEFDRLVAELKSQRELLMQVVRMEQERYDFLLKLIQSGVPAGSAVPTPPAAASLPPAAAAAIGGSASGGAQRKGHEPVAPTATITGRVSVTGGKVDDIFVYVENLRAAPVRDHSFEIRQKGKQFVPQVAVLQRGTTVTFPNLDPVFHNVFSPSPTQPFDLGTYRQGDEVRKVTLRTPGVIDVYCNMHGRMRASVLVVPNGYFAKVGSDGTFKIPNVPVGVRRVVAWAPDAKPALATLDLGRAGGQLEMTLEALKQRAHNNKLGQPYGSYQE